MRGAAAALLLAGLVPLLGRRPAGPPPSGEGQEEGRGWTARPDEAADRAVERALRWLAGPESYVPRDGSFLLGDAENPAPVAVTALAALAFLAHGECEDRGRYGSIVAGAVAYLLRHQVHAPGRVDDGYFQADNDKLSRTHGHGYATLCLAEALGQAGYAQDSPIPGEKAIRSALVRAVRFIERIQGPSGGWYYYPYRDPESHEGSVTITLVQALRAARNAGIKVDVRVIRKAENYVHRLQRRDGSFRYMLGSERPSTMGLTAAAIATLNMTGIYDDPAIARGLAWLKSQERFRQARRRFMGEAGFPFPFYERLYLAQAYWQSRSLAHWKTWFAREKAYILKLQRTNGSWASKKYGAVYATAVNCLVLQMPYNYLPIFQR